MRSVHSGHRSYRVSVVSSMLSHVTPQASRGYSLVPILHSGQKILWFAGFCAATLVYRGGFLIYLLVRNIDGDSSWSPVQTVLYYIPGEVVPMALLLCLYLAPVLEACFAGRQRDDRDEDSDGTEVTDGTEVSRSQAAGERDAAVSTALAASSGAAPTLT